MTDVCVPISRLPDCIDETKKDIAALPFPAVVVGHIGDGNFHVILLLDAANPEESEAAKRFNDTLVERAIAMDGTSTGEHGIGMGKRELLRHELGDAVDLMADIKRALDPEGIMNPERYSCLGQAASMAPLIQLWPGERAAEDAAECDARRGASHSRGSHRGQSSRSRRRLHGCVQGRRSSVDGLADRSVIDRDLRSTRAHHA